MTTRMLIDARHSEETRVAIVRGNRVEEFDYESANKQQLKGNIYLAKITRVEPSLQAAFVEYGGNRHGFLAFSEIHPDYYQIPVEDREALLAAERAEESVDDSIVDEALPDGKDGDDPADVNGEQTSEQDDEENGNGDNGDNGDNGTEEDTGEKGEEEIAESIRKRRSMRSLSRRYKIQEVIKKRQILLIQVVKEERGNKGAALTTYLSLAGRFCVLMPNSTHGGGISRKISNVKDRKKLRTVMDAMEVPDGMGCIIRTAGLNRTKTEIKRDLDYLVRLWSDIRELTLKSIAPALTYEEGNLIKRAIRDLYDKDIEEIHVEGEESYKAAREFMKLLMPSHARKVQQYTDKIPLFHRHQVENQIEAMLDPVVTLKSGGYIVINPTEALIAIDVNSGKSTREHNIEETALKTNLEAATEVGRQLRLRDLAGLIVIDFIDMERRGNNRKLERQMKEALKDDRARIQVGRVSNFGLLEMSRQRLRPNLFEVSTETCPHCEGTGRIRTIESSALHALRAVEEEALRRRNSRMRLSVPGRVAIYVLNRKRSTLQEIEERYGLQVEVQIDDNLIAPNFELVRLGAGKESGAVGEVITQDTSHTGGPASPAGAGGESGSGEPARSRGRRRGGRGKKEEGQASPVNQSTDAIASTPRENVPEDGTTDDKPRKRRRRGRRGGRRRSGARPEEASAVADGVSAEGPIAVSATDASVEAKEPRPDTSAGTPAVAEKDDKPKRPRRGRAAKPQTEDKAVLEDKGPVAEAAQAEEKPKPARRRGRPPKTDTGTDATTGSRAAAADEAVEPTPASDDAKKPARKPAARKAAANKKDATEAAKTAKTAVKTADKTVAKPARAKPVKTTAEGPDKAPATDAGSRTRKADATEKKVTGKKAGTKAADKASGKDDAGKEPVTVGAEAGSSEGSGIGAPEKKRRGWWQRG